MKRRVETLFGLGEKRRRDIRSLLDHAVRLDPRVSQRLVGGEASSGPIEAMLRKRGAPSTCYVLAADPRLDGREMPLDEALQAVIGMGDGAFISCLPGRLGVYEYAEIKSSYLLTK